MFPRVEIIRPDGHKNPTVLVQRREDEETFAMSVQQAWELFELETEINGDDCDGTACLQCALFDALFPAVR